MLLYEFPCFYNSFVPVESKRRTFTLEDTKRLLPKVQARTVEAVEDARHLSETLAQVSDSDPLRVRILKELDGIVKDWARDITAMGLVPNGLWLVDFDNGDGYYCWKHPESSVQHYHSYEDGFAGRVKII